MKSERADRRQRRAGRARRRPGPAAAAKNDEQADREQRRRSRAAGGRRPGRRCRPRPCPRRGATSCSFMTTCRVRVPGCHGASRRCTQHALEVVGIVRLQQHRVARQVHVPQAREPEAERAGAHQRRQQADLGALERAHALVGLDQRLGAVFGEPARLEVDAPVVEGDGDVEQQAVDAGEIEVEHAGQRAGPSNITLSRNRSPWIGAARQRRVGRRRGEVLLVRELVLHQRGAARRRDAAAPPARSRSTRPGRAGSAARGAKSRAGQVQAGEHARRRWRSRRHRARGGARRAGGRRRPPACPSARAAARRSRRRAARAPAGRGRRGASSAADRTAARRRASRSNSVST